MLYIILIFLSTLKSSFFDLYHITIVCRLPEELNGDRCFGGSLVDVLRGYGYDVHTSAIASIHVESPSSDMCDCKVRADWLGNFIDSIQRYSFFANNAFLDFANIKLIYWHFCIDTLSNWK